jgi:cytoskeletal protein RodZ
MEFTGIQIAISVIVILGAAGVALLCDYLKAKNDQLREAMVELRVRREEEAVRVATASPRTNVTSRPPEAPVTAPPVEPVAAPPPVVEHSIAPVAEQAATAVVAKVAANHARRELRSNAHANGHQDHSADSLVRKPMARAPKPPVNTTIVRGEDLPAEFTSRSGRRQPPPPPEVEAVPKQGPMNSNEALTDWLRRRAAARAAHAKQQTVSAPAPAVEPAPIEATPVQIAQEPVVAEAVPTAEVIVEPIAESMLSEPVKAEEFAQFTTLPEVHIDAFLWESLISDTLLTAAPAAVAQEQPAAAEIQFQLIRGLSSTSDELLVPAGMHDESDLSRLLSINKPFTGLVVSIGISENDGRAPRNEDVVRAAALYIGSLLGESDFGCRTGIDEFIMICTGKQGAEAQRRLSKIAERLWDYQLRDLGMFSTLMSWGGVDVTNEPLSEAVASATERMYQTKRSRKTVSMDSVSNRRMAV